MTDEQKNKDIAKAIVAEQKKEKMLNAIARPFAWAITAGIVYWVVTAYGA